MDQQIKHEPKPELWGMDPATVKRNLEVAHAVLVGHTLSEIAKASGLSLARVRQITHKCCRLGRPDLYQKAQEDSVARIEHGKTKGGKAPVGEKSPRLNLLIKEGEAYLESFPWDTYSPSGR